LINFRGSKATMETGRKTLHFGDGRELKIDKDDEYNLYTYMKFPTRENCRRLVKRGRSMPPACESCNERFKCYTERDE
jgi:hypothetical protein